MHSVMVMRGLQTRNGALCRSECRLLLSSYSHQTDLILWTLPTTVHAWSADQPGVIPTGARASCGPPATRQLALSPLLSSYPAPRPHSSRWRQRIRWRHGISVCDVIHWAAAGVAGTSSVGRRPVARRQQWVDIATSTVHTLAAL